MNSLIELQSGFLKALGISIIHSLWEGVVVFVFILLLLGLVKKDNAKYRHMILYSGLMIMLAGFIITFIHFMQVFTVDNTIPSTGRIMSFSPVNQSLSDLSYSAQPGASFSGFVEWMTAKLDPAAPFLAVCWFIGFLYFGIRFISGLYISQVIIRKNTIQSEPDIQELFNRVRNAMNINEFVNLRISLRKISPMVIGMLKPVVIVPLAAIANLSPSQTEAIIAHELAHIKRYDHLFLIFQELAEQILFFHPLTWYLRSEINREREHSCDDLVVKTYTDPINYIKALTMVQEMNLSGMTPANAVISKPKRLLLRIKRLMQPHLNHSPFLRLTTVSVFLIIAGITLATAIVIPRKTDNNLNSKPQNLNQQNVIQPPDSSRVIIEEIIVTTGEDEEQKNERTEVRIIVSGDTTHIIKYGTPATWYDSLANIYIGTKPFIWNDSSANLFIGSMTSALHDSMRRNFHIGVHPFVWNDSIASSFFIGEPFTWNDSIANSIFISKPFNWNDSITSWYYYNMPFSPKTLRLYGEDSVRIIRREYKVSKEALDSMDGDIKDIEKKIEIIINDSVVSDLHTTIDQYLADNYIGRELSLQPWDSLFRNQTLSGRQWLELSQEERQRAIEQMEEQMKLSQEERQRAMEQMEQQMKISQEERQRAMEHMEQQMKISEEERQRVMEQMEEQMKLSQEERQRTLEAFERAQQSMELSQEERQRAIEHIEQQMKISEEERKRAMKLMEQQMKFSQEERQQVMEQMEQQMKISQEERQRALDAFERAQQSMKLRQEERQRAMEEMEEQMQNIQQERQRIIEEFENQQDIFIEEEEL